MLLDVSYESRHIEVGERLLRGVLEEARSLGVGEVGHVLDAPPMWPRFRHSFDKRVELLGRSGFVERRETIRFEWTVARGLAVLRVGLGSIFVPFGILKFFPNASPAQGPATRTTEVLTFGVAPADVSLVLVAALECTIGIGLISGRFLRLTLAAPGFQMVGAMSPLLLFTGDLFSGPYHAPTLEAQYIFKDVVLISVGLVLGATLHGGRIVTERVRPAEDYTRYNPAPSTQPHRLDTTSGA